MKKNKTKSDVDTAGEVDKFTIVSYLCNNAVQVLFNFPILEP